MCVCIDAACIDLKALKYLADLEFKRLGFLCMLGDGKGAENCVDRMTQEYRIVDGVVGGIIGAGEGQQGGRNLRKALALRGRINEFCDVGGLVAVEKMRIFLNEFRRRA